MAVKICEITVRLASSAVILTLLRKACMQDFLRLDKDNSNAEGVDSAEKQRSCHTCLIRKK